MDQKNWSKLAEVVVNPAHAPWFLALDYVPAGTLLRIECTDGTAGWKYHHAPPLSCGPNGDARSPLANGSLPLSSAAVGCLVAKLGGSSAANDGTLFAVGSFCVRTVGEADAGPLFLGINASAATMPSGEMRVRISEAKR